MKKRNLIATAAVLVLSIQAGFATNISGVTGVNGVYDINPTQISGDKGFRHYETFRLSENDIANLIMKSGAKDLNTFINMVDNKVSIYGILNTVRNGEFANGHAVFISPNGMIIGENGVLNVGSLSVLTPTQNKYNNLLTDGAKMDLNSIKNEANADILIRGKILSRGNVNIQGADVALPETSVILNGVSDNSLIQSQEDVNTVLFNNLVNTSNLRAADNLTSEAGKIVIRANSTDKMLNVRGTVANYNSGNIELTNNGGAGGLKVSGTIANADGNLELLNDTGKTLLKGSLENDGGFILISDKGDGVHLNSGSSVIAHTGSIKIENDGTDGLSIYGDVKGLDGDVSLENNAGKLYISGNVDYEGDGNFQIINNAEDTQLMITKNGKINSTNDAFIKNSGSNGLFVNGTVNADNSLVLDNTSGDLTVNNAVTAGNGLSLQNSGNKLSVSSNGSVINDAGNLVIKNSGEKGALIYGTVENDGDVISIKNTKGDLNINGKIDAKSGDLGIVNEGGNILYIKNNSVISTQDGKTNIINDGENGLYVLGKFTTDGDDALIQNDNGKLYISGNVDYQGTGKLQIINNAEDNQLMIAKTAQVNSINDAMIKNNGDGGLFVNGTVNADNSLVLNNTKGDLTVNNAVTAGNGLSLQNSGNKLSVSSKGSVINDAGNLVLRNTGANGSVIYGTVENDGDTISITNTAGDLNINGNITAKSGNLGIINDGNRLYLKDNSVITNNEGETNIVNNGAGGLKAVGAVNVGEKILNLHNNAGQGYIDGNVTSNGGNISILSKDNSKGIYIRKNASITNIPEIETDLAGNIIIKDSASAAGNGLIIKGTVKSGNNVAASSENNNVYLGGTVDAKNDIKFSQSAVNGTMTFNNDAKVTAGGKVTTEVTNGSKIRDMRPKN